MNTSSKPQSAYDSIPSQPSPYLTGEHEAFRASVRRFLADEVIPHAEEWEREGRVPREVWSKMGETGFLGVNYPREYGGSGQDFFSSVVYLEELGRTGYAGFRAAIGVHQFMASWYLLHAGGDLLKQRYLADCIKGRKIAALAITEWGTGSDMASMQTSAVKEGDDFLVSGSKAFVVNGTGADFYIVAVRTSAQGGMRQRNGAGISLILVDAAAPGVTSKRVETMGWHCADTAQLLFDNVRVPATHVIGRVDSGFFYLMQCFQLERLAAAVLALGGADACIEELRRRLATRKAFGGTLAQFQVLRHRMADLYTELYATRELVYKTAWLYSRGDLPVKECSMAKLKATELSNRLAAECMQLHGAHGYLAESAAARMYRDTPVGTLGAGTSEIIRDIIAELVLD